MDIESALSIYFTSNISHEQLAEFVDVPNEQALLKLLNLRG